MRTFIRKQHYSFLFTQILRRSLRFLACAIDVFEKQGTVRAEHTLPPRGDGGKMPIATAAAFGRSKGMTISTLSFYCGHRCSSLTMVLLKELIVAAPAGGASHTI